MIQGLRPNVREALRRFAELIEGLRERAALVAARPRCWSR